MPATQQTQRDSLQARLRAQQRRLMVLEQQQATKGISTPPEIVTEIEDLRREIAEGEAVLNPPLGVPRHVWDSLDADQQRTYLTALVMQLQADFKECQLLILRRLRWAIVAVVVSQVITFGVAVVAMVR